MREEVVLFGKSKSLVGIVTDPSANEASRKRPAVILLNRERNHRVGPCRVYVKVARDLASQGFTALRFDFSGIGDSGIRADHLPFDKSAVSETREAMDYLHASRGSEQFVLVGICSTGSSISCKTAAHDHRVISIVLINPGMDIYGELTVYGSVRSRSDSYWRAMKTLCLNDCMRLFKIIVDFRKLLRIVYTLVVLLWYQVLSLFSGRDRNLFSTIHSDSGLFAFTKRGVHTLLIDSEACYWKAEYCRSYAEKCSQEQNAEARLEMKTIQELDYNFHSLRSREYIGRVIHDWVQMLDQD